MKGAVAPEEISAILCFNREAAVRAQREEAPVHGSCF